MFNNYFSTLSSNILFQSNINQVQANQINTISSYLLLIPKLNTVESANANSGRWQLAQLTVESFDRNFSLNNNSPNFFLLNFFDWLSMNEDAKKLVNKMKMIGNITLFKCVFYFTLLRHVMPLIPHYQLARG
jgi:hypothetical protein